MGVIDDVLSITDEVLGLRDDLGAALAVVNIVTRTWTGATLGQGTGSEVTARILPTPRIVNLKNDYKLMTAGMVQQGDIMLKYISKESYTSRAMIDNVSSTKNVEKFYEVGGILYKVIDIEESYVYWNVQLRRLSDQRRYP